jgi:polyhydroxyalkanoate synthase
MTDERPGSRRGPWGAAALGPGVRLAAALAGRPLTLARRGAGLSAELARIALGRSRLAPPAGDPRYADPAWRDNPLLRRAVQVHLAAVATVHDLVDDARLPHFDGEQVRAAVDAVAEALAPSNTPLNPTVWRAVSGSASTGTSGAAVADLEAAPTRVATAAAGLEVGTHVAATPGAVVLRTPVFELLQYLPQTETVREVPLVVIPPVHGRYYLADLAPGRSIVEHLVRAGQQVFAISWRNPGPRRNDDPGDSPIGGPVGGPVGGGAGWDLDTYGRAVLEAMDAAEHIARTPRTALMAFGSGGTITAMLLGHLAAIGMQERVASVTFVETVLDREGARMEPPPGHPVTDLLGRPYRLRSSVRGEPAVSEVLFWNADATRIPAGLHHGLTDVMVRRALAVPAAANMMGTALDLTKVDRDCYVVAGAGDRTAPWPDVYRTARLFGGASRFVLADGGHLGSIVSPPGDAGTSYRAAARPTGAAPVDSPPHDWIALAAVEHRSWWDDHLAWLAERTGPEHDAPPELGGRGLHALAPAPGEYVLER